MIDLENDDVIHEDSDTQFSWLERDETLQTPDYVAPHMTLKDKISMVVCNLGCFICGFAVLALLFIGFITTLDWFFN